MKTATKKAIPQAPRRAAKVKNVRNERTPPMKKFPLKARVPLKIGDKVRTDINGGVHTVEHDRNGLFIRCAYGRHYLLDHGYRDGNAVVGVSADA
jgi:hypothetical protein